MRLGLLAGAALLEAVLTLVGVLVADLDFATAADSFLVTNSALGFGCAACGALIARRRPDNALGWLLLGAGVTEGATAAVTPWLVHALAAGWPDAAVRALGTAYSLGWPWSISLFIPLTLLTFPDGRLLWPPIRVIAVANAAVQVLLFSADPNSAGLTEHVSAAQLHASRSWLALPSSTALDVLGWASHGLLVLLLLAAIVSLARRYRRGDEKTRRQLLWLLLATALTIVVIVTSRATTGEEPGIPVLFFTLVAAVPVSIAIAILRYQLLDIRLVWSRAVTYLVLTGGIVGAYAGLVAATGSFVDGRAASVAIVVAAALIANPVRVRLQRAVDRLLYGDRADPMRVVGDVTQRLATAYDPADVVPAVCAALRLPYAALYEGTDLVAEYGRRPDPVVTVQLHAAGETVGALVVGVRSGQRRLSSADRAVLELLAAPLGLAVRATALSGRITTLREDERARMRRDLHDGLGPALTGIAFQADAVGNLVRTDPGRAGELAASMRGAVGDALDDVRRLVYELRPTALDDLGLVEAVRRHARTLDRRVTVSVAADVPALPPAVEVAAYRIVTEALTNVVRHSPATHVDVHLAGTGEDLTVTVQDDAGHSDEWRAGVGLQSMSERAAALGGTIQVGPTPQGGRVHARLPIGVAT